MSITCFTDYHRYTVPCHVVGPTHHINSSLRSHLYSTRELSSPRITLHTVYHPQVSNPSSLFLISFHTSIENRCHQTTVPQDMSNPKHLSPLYNEQKSCTFFYFIHTPYSLHSPPNPHFQRLNAMHISFPHSKQLITVKYYCKAQIF